jgi:hypothetical protein
MSTAVFEPQAVRDERPDVWRYVSASRLNAWLRCPLAFKLKYIDGIHEPTTAPLFVGNAVHASLETFYRNRQLGLTLGAEDLSRRLMESWGQLVDTEEAVFESVAEEQACIKQAYDLVAAYLRAIPADEARPMAVEASVEAPLVDPATGEDFGIPMVGIMDLVLDEPAGPLIADFKTAARKAEPLEITHEVQLSCYSYLFRHASAAEEAGLEIRNLVKTKTPQVHFYRYPARDERHFQRLFAVIRAYLDVLDSGRFVYRPGFLAQAARSSRHIAGHGPADLAGSSSGKPNQRKERSWERRRPSRIAHRIGAVTFTAGPIPTPLRDVPAHIEQAEGAWQLHRTRPGLRFGIHKKPSVLCQPVGSECLAMLECAVYGANRTPHVLRDVQDAHRNEAQIESGFGHARKHLVKKRLSVGKIELLHVALQLLPCRDVKRRTKGGLVLFGEGDRTGVEIGEQLRELDSNGPHVRRGDGRSGSHCSARCQSGPEPCQ